MNNEGNNQQIKKSNNNKIKVKLTGKTDVGLVREHNEDNFIIANLDTGERVKEGDLKEIIIGEKGILLAVCDGMGGAAAGEIASQIAVDSLFEVLNGIGPFSSENELILNLEQAVIEAGEKIYYTAKMDQTRFGMGTTLTAGVLFNRRLIFAQVGDSRAYIIRGDKIVQLTKDQSLVEQLIEAGQIKPEDASKFEHSNIILQALGTESRVNVDISYVDLCRGDKILLCSDGLSGLLSESIIKQVILDNQDNIVKATEELINKAKEKGGHDNITVILAEFYGEELPIADDKEEELKFRRLEVKREKSERIEKSSEETAPSILNLEVTCEDEKKITLEEKQKLLKIKEEKEKIKEKHGEEEGKKEELTPLVKKKKKKSYFKQSMLLIILLLITLLYGVVIGYWWGKKENETKERTKIPQEILKGGSVPLLPEKTEKKIVLINRDPFNTNMNVELTLGNNILSLAGNDNYTLILKEIPNQMKLNLPNYNNSSHELMFNWTDIAKGDIVLVTILIPQVVVPEKTEKSVDRENKVEDIEFESKSVQYESKLTNNQAEKKETQKKEPKERKIKKEKKYVITNPYDMEVKQK